MIFYLLLGVYFVCALLGEKKYNSKTTRVIVVIIYILPLFLLTALRDVSIGPDTSEYFRSFYSISSKSSLAQAIEYSHFEPGYSLLNYLIGKLGGSYYLMQGLISAFLYYSVGRFIYKHSDNIAFSCFLLLANTYVFGMMNVVRMWLAVAILLFDIKPLQERKMIRFIIIALVAASFHYSALLFLLIYPLANNKITLKKIVMLFAGATTISIAAIPFFTFITNTIGLYQSYITEARFDTSENLAVKISLLVNVCFFVLATVTHAWEDEDERYFKNSHDSYVPISSLSYWGMVLSVGISIIGLSNNIMGRLIRYFSVFDLYLIPHSIKKLRIQNNKKIMLCVIMSLLFIEFVIIMIYRPDWYQVTPYRFFFTTIS